MIRFLMKNHLLCLVVNFKICFDIKKKGCIVLRISFCLYCLNMWGSGYTKHLIHERDTFQVTTERLPRGTLWMDDPARLEYVWKEQSETPNTRECFCTFWEKITNKVNLCLSTSVWEISRTWALSILTL